MLKRNVVYVDFNGEQVVETLYFNISKSELVELEVSESDGFSLALRRIVETQNVQSLIREFKRLILMAYGVRSEDGKRFIKSVELANEFAQTAAFDALFMELAGDENAAAAFIQGILPGDLASAVSEKLQTEGALPSFTPPAPGSFDEMRLAASFDPPAPPTVL